MSDSQPTSALPAARLRRPARLFAFAALGVAALAGCLLAATSSATRVAARAGSARPVVAIVQSASGGHLSDERKPGGNKSALHAGSKIRYGDTVLAGPGAKAKFKVTVPKGDPGTHDLLDIKEVSGAHHTILAVRTAKNVIEVTLRH